MAMMSSWTKQQGFPVLMVNETKTSRALVKKHFGVTRFHQMSFSFDRHEFRSDRQWNGTKKKGTTKHGGCRSRPGCATDERLKRGL